MNEILSNTIDDLVANFLYYDRKEDEELPRGAIEEMIEKKEATVEEIVGYFWSELEHQL